MSRKLLLLFAIMISFASAGTLFAQATTASITGKVVDANGEALIGATVVAIHQASGTQYGTTTRGEGRFTLPNLRVGGPYLVQASYIGYETAKFDKIHLQLAQKLNLSFELKETGVVIDEIEVTANSDGILNNERTGASTNISNDVIQKLPSISRSAKDYYRLTPSSDGNSFGGRNNKFNNFTLDGSIFNNPFGLDAATPGSQTNAQPVSLDAIEQVQVNIAPYDVTQAGFTGAAVNAVTKSGTNDLKGTVFGFYRNQNMTGHKVGDDDVFKADLSQLQTGFSLGGPIVKDKLFFFANAEIERRSDLGSQYLAARPGLTGGNVSRVEAADLELVSKTLKDRFGYETGAYEKFNHRTDNAKGIFKLDWNLAQGHTLTATYNFLDASRDKPAHPEAIGRRGPDLTTLQFENSGYAIQNKIQSGILELNSIFGSSLSNHFQLGFTAFRDSRAPFSTPFPVINISKDGSRYIIAGHEPFSVHNRLHQNVFQFTDNVSIYAGNHTITAGVSFEKFSFRNSFNLTTYAGVFGGYASVEDFVTAVNNGDLDADVAAAQATFDLFGGDSTDDWGVDKDPNADGFQGWALAETNVGQASLYAQDEMAIGDNFLLTIGLRVDKPLYFDTPTKAKESIDRNCCYDPTIVYHDVDGNEVKLDSEVFPDAKPLLSPRFGFNWDMNGDKSMMIRGGSGLFTGRFPFVWVGNQVANPNWWFYTSTTPDFQFPQVWRSNLGLDTKFAGGWTASFDVIYTKDVHAMLVRNYGLNKPSGTLKDVDGRPIYLATDRSAPFGNDAYVFTNTNIGQSFNASVQLQKNWSNGLFTSIAYSFLDSKDASSIPAEITSDAFARNPAFGHVNEAVLAYSRYGNRHRVVGSAYKKIEYGKMATTFAVFFEYAQGGRYSYTYSGDINGDGSGLNDLIYVPTESDLNSMTFTDDTQRSAYNEYIKQDEYLNSIRGQYAEKYAVLSPWYSDWDLRILQDFMVGKNNVQFSIDVVNLGNLINSKWGVRQLPINTQPIGVAFDTDVDPNKEHPIYSFDPSLKKTYANDLSLLSRWQLQLGLRYSF